MKTFAIPFVLFALGVNGQSNIFIHIDPVFSGAALNMSSPYTAHDNSLLKLDHFDYYVSNFIITHDGGQETSFDYEVHLIEPSNHVINLGYLPIQQVEKINFLVGVPKELNTQSGIFAQDISTRLESDPLSFQSPSMYWGWQAGYMHMIIGGNNDLNNNNNIEGNEGYFEFHNLGDQNQQPVEISPVIQTNTTSDQTDIFISCHVDRWIQGIPLGQTGVAHGSTGINQTILNNVVDENVFELSSTAQIPEASAQDMIYIVSKGELTIQWLTGVPPKGAQVVTSEGKIIYQQNLIENCEKIELKGLEAGLYFVTAEGESGRLLKTIFVP